MKTLPSVLRNQVSPSALAIALLIGSAVWFAGAGAWSATRAAKADWAAASLFWMLILMVTPAVCFAGGAVLVNTRQPSRFSPLEGCALLAAVFPVTLGSGLAVWAVKVLFWASFQEASVGLKIFGAGAGLALVAIAGAMIWKTAMNYLSGKRPDERPVA